MATKPNNTTRLAVHITPAGWDSSVLLTFEEMGAANAAVQAINERSDAKAEHLGNIHETPMIVTDAADSFKAMEKMNRNFALMMPGKRLLDLAGQELFKDPGGDYYTATARWVFANQAVAAEGEV